MSAILTGGNKRPIYTLLQLGAISFILTLLMACAKVPTQPEDVLQSVDEPVQSQQTTPLPGLETFAITLIIENNMPHYLTVLRAVNEARNKWESVITTGLPGVLESEFSQLQVPELAQSGIMYIDDIVIVVRWKGSDDHRVANVPFIAPREEPTYLPYYSEVWIYDGFLDPNYNAQDRTNVIIHEFAHALGFNEYVIGKTAGTETVGVIPFFNGANAIAAYREILYHYMGEKLAFGIPDLRVPMVGTSHWRYPELQWDIMQPYGMPGSVLTKVTVGAMEDLGYKVDYSQAEYPPRNLTKPAIGQPVFKHDHTHIHVVLPEGRQP